MKQVVLLYGPTATGKSALGLLLAQEFGGEIVSADSMQVYRGMNIGTAKATREEREIVPHHCLNLCDIEDTFSVADYHGYAVSAIRDILGRGKLPMVIGGTGQYFDSLLYRYSYGKTACDPPLRAALQARLSIDGREALYRELCEADPVCARGIHPHDERRIVRALEIFHATGMPPSQAQTRSPNTEFDFLHLYLSFTTREALYAAIEARVDGMMAAGLLTEVTALLGSGLDRTPTAAQAIGYKELISHLKGECSLEEAVALIKQRTRNYAKRQTTWFSRYQEALPLRAGKKAKCEKMAKEAVFEFRKGASC